MSEWNEYRVSDLCELIGGGTPKTTNPEYWNGNIPWLSVTDFNTGRKFCFDAEKKITEKGLKESSTKILKKGQIIISARGTVGVISMLGNDMAFNQSNYGIEAKKEITTNDFLYYLLKDNLAEFLSASYGAVFDTITKETFNQVKVLLPTLKEQTAIAEVLSSIDDKIDLLHRQNKTLEQLAETIFRQWFVEEAETKVVGTLGDYVENANTGLDAIKRAPIVEEETGIKCLRIQDVSQGKIFDRWGNSKVEENNFKKFQLKRDDIIMARTCSPGINLFIREDLPAVFNNGLVRIRAKKDKVYPVLLNYLFKTREFIGHIDGISGGTSVQLNMQVGELLSYEFSFPSLEKQNEIIESFNALDEKIFYNQNQIKTLTNLRDTLLPKLMSGEVRVSEK